MVFLGFFLYVISSPLAAPIRWLLMICSINAAFEHHLQVKVSTRMCLPVLLVPCLGQFWDLRMLLF
jgi:hypothetical protein